MKSYVFSGEFNAALFSEELVAAFSALIVEEKEERRARFTLAYDGKTLLIQSEIALDERTLKLVVSNHDPRGESKNQKKDKRQKELEKSIEDKLLGLGFTKEEIGFLGAFLDSRR